MENTERKDVQFTGKWFAIDPIAQTPPTGENWVGPKPSVPMEPRSFPGAGLDAEGDVVGIVNIPVIPGNKVRGLIRNLVAAQMLKRIPQGTMDFDSLFAMVAGGVFSRTTLSIKERHEIIKDLRSRNLLLDLLACATSATGMMRGRLAVHNALVDCYETVDETKREGYARARQLVTNIPFARRDDMEDYDIMSMLSEAGIQEMEDQEEVAKKTTKANKAKKNGEEAVEKDEPKEAQRPQISFTPAVASGTVWRQTIAGTDLLDAQIGAIISVFREFARWPYIGGFANKGFGRVDVDFVLKVRGSDTLTEFGVKNGEFYVKNGEQYLAAWGHYLDTKVTCIEDIRIPHVEKKEAPAGSEKKPKGGVKRGPAVTEPETDAPASDA